MDAIRKELGQPTRYILEADEWTEAYRQSLSGNARNKFDKEWDKYNKDLEDYFSATDKQRKNLNPMDI